MSYKLIASLWVCIARHPQSTQNNKFTISLQYLKENIKDEADVLHKDKHQSFLQVDFNTSVIKVSYKVILSLLAGMTKHSQSTQSRKFAVSFQYLKKEVRHGVHFLHADKHHLTLLFLMEASRQVQSTQNRKLVIFFQ